MSLHSVMAQVATRAAADHRRAQTEIDRLYWAHAQHLRDDHGYSIRRIARTLGISERTIRGWVTP